MAVSGGPRRVVARTAAVSSCRRVVVSVGAVWVTTTSPPKLMTMNISPAKPKPMALTAAVAEGSVSKMVSSEGALAATNLGFPVGHFLVKLNVKVGDKVKKDQLLAVEGQSGPLEALIQSQQLLTSQQGELALILNDVTVPGDLRILEAAGTVAGDARRNIELKAKADDNTLRRARELLKIDEQAAEAALKKAQADGCGPNGPLTALPTAAETALCATDDAAVKAAELTVFNQRMTVITDEDNLRVDRGNLETTYAQDLVTVKTDENAYRIAATNRPSQIAIQQALYLADQAVVVTNQGMYDNPFIYAPVDATVTAITGQVGEWMALGCSRRPRRWRGYRRCDELLRHGVADQRQSGAEVRADLERLGGHQHDQEPSVGGAELGSDHAGR